LRRDGLENMPDPLESSRRKIARAKEHIANLEREMAAFLEARPYTAVVELDPKEPKHEVHKLRFNRGLPDTFSNFTSEAVHSLRDALDNAGYGLAVAAGGVKPKFTAFPFAGSAIEFENGMKGRCKDIPEEIRAIFRAYQPYKGGNDFLWALNEVAVADKHKLLTIALNSLLGDVFGEGAIHHIPLNPTWNSLKREIEVLTGFAGHPMKCDIEISLFIAFDEIPFVAGEPVLKVLSYFVDIVQDILSRIEVEARRLGLIPDSISAPRPDYQ
jgi:hypothetical protein